MTRRLGVLGRKLVVVLVAAMVLGTMGTGFASAMTPTVSKELYRSGHGEVFLPRVTGLRSDKLQETVNAKLKSTILAFAADRADVSLQGDFEVLFNNGKLLTVRFFGYSMQAGAAHPNKIDQGVHMDLTTGKIYALSDLFYPGVDFAAKIIELCEKQQNESRLQIEGLAADWQHADFANSWTGSDRAFVLGLSSLRAYSIPNYAIGSISGYQVSYADLLPIIDQSGLLWQSLRGNVIDPNRIKLGDRVAGLSVVSLEKSRNFLNDVSFAGEIELTGTIEWLENTGDGPGYLFTVTAPDSSKLPALGRERDTRLIALDFTVPEALRLTQVKTPVRIVIDNFSLGERQISTRAKVLQLHQL